MVRLLYQDEIESYFAPAVVMEGRPDKYKRHFASLIDRANKSVGNKKASRGELQYYKDETILTWHTFVSMDKIHKATAGKGVWETVLSKAFRHPDNVKE